MAHGPTSAPDEQHDDEAYAKPRIISYGTVMQMTRATALAGDPDNNSRPSGAQYTVTG